MKIIKHGTKILGHFICDRCECEFEENIKNCRIGVTVNYNNPKHDPVDIPTAFVVCPDCGKECATYLSDFMPESQFMATSTEKPKEHIDADEMNNILYETKYYNIPYGTPEYYTFVEKKFGYTRENSDIC